MRRALLRNICRISEEKAKAFLVSRISQVQESMKVRNNSIPGYEDEGLWILKCL